LHITISFYMKNNLKIMHITFEMSELFFINLKIINVLHVRFN
jgi:hypothetical protein